MVIAPLSTHHEGVPIRIAHLRCGIPWITTTDSHICFAPGLLPRTSLRVNREHQGVEQKSALRRGRGSVPA